MSLQGGLLLSWIAGTVAPQTPARGRLIWPLERRHVTAWQMPRGRYPQPVCASGGSANMTAVADSLVQGFALITAYQTR